MEIDKLIGETSDLEKKVELEIKKPVSWLKSVSAFANSYGGQLIFGISDNDEIIGLDDPVKDSEVLSEIIKNKLNPLPEFKVKFVENDEKVLMSVYVNKGEETPYYVSTEKGLEAYTRVGNESVKASPVEIKRLVLRGKNTTYDSLVSKYKIEDFSFSKLKERYKKWTSESFDEKDLISFGLIEGQYLTNAGALIVDESPIFYSRLFCTRWNGFNKGNDNVLDSAEYNGSLISLIENGKAFIKRNSKLMWRKTPNSREEMPDYVERSYHEALVNALAHRDYLVVGGEVHIDIYNDRLEITSPGGMVDGSRVQDRDIFTIPSTRRNPVIADMFNRLGFMERKGSGFSKIINNYVNQINYRKNKKPYFKSDPYQFMVVMPNLNYGIKENGLQKPKDEIREKILTLIKLNPTITIGAIASKLDISKRTVDRKIKELKEENLINRVATGKKGLWKVKDGVVNGVINETINDTEDDKVSDTIKAIEDDELKKKIFYILKANPNITIDAIAFRVGLSRSSVQRKIYEMKVKKIIEHVGSRKDGEWKINIKNDTINDTEDDTINGVLNDTIKDV